MNRIITVPLTRSLALTLAMVLPTSLSLTACGADDCEEDEKVLGVCPDIGDDEAGDGDGEGDGEGGEEGGEEGGGGDDGGDTFTALYDGGLDKCGICHVPGGATSETGLNFSDRSSAYSSITGGKAGGLTGNQSGCNDVPFIGSSAGNSLIVAVLDEDVRVAFDDPAHPDCNGNGSISDMSFRSGMADVAGTTAALKAWITAGAPND